MKKLMGILLAVTLLFTVAAASAETITVVTREAGSGTRGAFVELTGVESKNEAGEKVDNTTLEAVTMNGTAQVITTVESDPNAIGYISLGSLGETVKAVKVEGVEATAANVQAGTYALARPFHAVTKPELSDTAKDFLAWILSEEGQAIVAEKGYVAGEPAAYEAAPVAGKIVVGGSSSVGPLMEKLAEAYQAINTNVTIEVQVSDSTTGVTKAIEGTFDIGMASRDLKDSEKEQGVTGTVLCQDGIAVIVNKDNPIEELTRDQIKDIFTGAVEDWEQIAK